MIPDLYLDNIVSRIAGAAHKYVSAPDTKQTADILDAEIRAAVRTVVTWHDVTKEMPDDDVQVLVYMENGNTHIDWVDKDTGQFMHAVTKLQVEEVTSKYGETRENQGYYRCLKSGTFITHWRHQVVGIDSP